MHRFLTVCFTIMALALVALLAVPARASSDLFALYAGANGAFFGQADPWNADVEAALNGKASLSPHVSAVGSVNYGFSHSYFRSTVGARVTASDVDNPDFSIGLGIQYHTASVADLRPDEWCPDVAVGWRPWPTTQPDLSLTALGWYGLTSTHSGATLGVRYRFKF